MIRHPELEQLQRLSAGTLDQVFIKRAQEGLSCSLFEAQALTDLVRDDDALLAGLDKFLHLLVDWNQYLAPAVANVISANVFMPIVGVVEVVAAIVVLVKPRFGGYLVAAWLVGIIVNLLIHPGSYDATGWGLDLALRDLGLALGALALARLATAFGK